MQKRLHIATLSLFLAVLFGFSVAFLLLPDKDFSAQENRSLRTFPRFSFESLASGDFSAAINDYFADQFPLRDFLVGIKGSAEIGMGKGENDGILLGRDGYLARRLYDMMRADGSITQDVDAFDAEHVRAACQGIRRGAENLELPFTVFLTGRTLDVHASAFDYPADYSDALTQLLREELAQSVNYVDTVPLYRELFSAGEEVYYHTDHHWTTLGAYYAYVEVMRSFGMEADVLPMTSFDRQTVSEEFYGTNWSAGGMKFVSPDRVELWYYGNENDFFVEADGMALEGFYTLRHLESKDKYSVFLDGTHDVVTVKKATGEERPTLVLFKDSFANSVAPFLAQHFDLVLLNLSSTRNDYTDLSARAEEYGADYVLLMYSMENVITTRRMNRVR